MNYTIFLSPSRQKMNVGNGDYGTESRRMNELGNIVEAELERHGIYVEREGNEIETEERVKLANNMKANAYVSLHSNYTREGDESQGVGTEIYVKGDDDESMRLGVEVYTQMRKVPGFIERGVRKNRSFKEVISPKMPSIMIEVDFHDSYERACWIVENMREIAVAITKGILKYFDMEYKEKETRKYYRIQLGAFTNKERAEQMARALQNKGYPTVIKYY